MQKENFSDHIQYHNEKFHRSVVFKDDLITALVLNFRPGQTLPAHHHPGTKVQLIVLEGEGVFSFDEKAVSAIKGDVLFVDGEQMISFTNNRAADTSIYVILHRTT